MLADSLENAIRTFPGSPEREQMALFLSKAPRLHISDTVARYVSETIITHPKSIEKNIDLVRLPCDPVWIEFNDAPRLTPFERAGFNTNRRVSEGSTPERIGALIATKPASTTSEAGAVVMGAWQQSDGSIHPGHAVMHWFWENFAFLGHHARFYYSNNGVESCAHMLDAIDVSIPKNLRHELQHLSEYRQECVESRIAREQAAQREVTGEALFLIGALLMLQSTAVTPINRTGSEKRRNQEVEFCQGKTPGRWLPKQPGFNRRLNGQLDWVRTEI